MTLTASMDIIYLILAALLPALLLIYYIFRKDKLKPEPKGQLVKGFFMGVGAAILVILALLPIGAGSLDETKTSVIGAVFNAFCFAAIPEEACKFLMLWLLVRSNKYFDEHIDGIVYAVCIGMGFAGAENILYLIDNYESWVSVGIIRGLISVPGHFFFAVAMGYYLSLAQFGDKAHRRTNLCMAIGVPILMHGVFDSILFAVNIIPSIGFILTVCFFLCFKKVRLFASGKITELYNKDKESFTA